MIRIFADMNWTAVIVTTIVCITILKVADHIKYVARIWLEGLKTELATQQEISRRMKR